MASHEGLLASALNLDQGRMEDYCRTVDPRFLERLNRERPSTMAALSTIFIFFHPQRVLNIFPTSALFSL